MSLSHRNPIGERFPAGFCADAPNRSPARLLLCHPPVSDSNDERCGLARAIGKRAARTGKVKD